MKNILYFMIMFGTLVGMTLMYSTKGMAATMPQGEFAGINIEKGTANGVTYETGGVGLEERAAMNESLHHYNLRLVFANAKGWYLSAVPVQIQTPDGKVLLSKKSNGPWFWAKLPAGQYEVMASYDKKQEVHKIDVGKTPQSVEFTWHNAK